MIFYYKNLLNSYLHASPPFFFFFSFLFLLYVYLALSLTFKTVNWFTSLSLDGSVSDIKLPPVKITTAWEQHNIYMYVAVNRLLLYRYLSGFQIWVYSSHIRTTSGQQVASPGLGEELWQGEMDY
jgi:hypothetical protein